MIQRKLKLGDTSDGLTRYPQFMVRTARLTPRQLAPQWPNGAEADPSAWVAVEFAANLRAAMGARSARSCAKLAGISHVTLMLILDGQTWPDMATISKLENALEADLWPGRGSANS